MEKEDTRILHKLDYTDFNKTVALTLGKLLKSEPISKDSENALEYKLATLACQEIIKNIYKIRKASEEYGLTFQVKDDPKETIDSCFSQAFDIPGISSDTSKEMKDLFARFLSEKYESIRNLDNCSIWQAKWRDASIWPVGNYFMKLCRKVHHSDDPEISEEKWYISVLNPAYQLWLF